MDWLPWRRGRMTAFQIVNLLFLVLALTVAGASRENAIPSAVVQLAALAIIPWATYRLVLQDRWQGAILPLVLLGLMYVIALVQLIPLPPSVWTALPGHDLSKSAYDAAGIPLPWRPISLTPHLGLRSMMSLTAPTAVFMAWLTMSSTERLSAVVTILSVALAGLVLGIVQIAGAGEATGYLYSNTNLGSLVGFFSNRNHEAALLLCALPLAAALAATRQDGSNRAPAIVMAAGVMVIVILALVAVKSRAGVLLLAPSIVLSLLILFSGLARNRAKVMLGIAAGLTLVLAIGLQFGLTFISDRFQNDISSESRFVLAPDIWAAAMAHLPFGSGLGSFDTVYRSVEKVTALRTAFFNHAHNDYLELWLEFGVVAALMLAGFLFWLALRTKIVWTLKSGASAPLAKAGWAVVILLLVHSTVEYPLRAMALSSVFAFACALMIPYRADGRSAHRSKR